ncbi:MAG: hypothetical protein KY475_00655 [Planctomycetes bacterium]|nr:hypothetical protein [Planctomycetota bacterium]
MAGRLQGIARAYGLHAVMVVLLALGGFLAGRLSGRAAVIEAEQTRIQMERDLERAIKVHRSAALREEWRSLDAE